MAAVAEPSTVRAQTAESIVAFRNVNIIPMDVERVETGRTVLVRGERIVAIGAADEISIPDDATVVEGGGRFLLPGRQPFEKHLEATLPRPHTRQILSSTMACDWPVSK